jgi:hypothetical protein
MRVLSASSLARRESVPALLSSKTDAHALVHPRDRSKITRKLAIPIWVSLANNSRTEVASLSGST